LSIVRRAVQAMGGRTWAERPPQGGAALCFTLPGAVIEAGAAQGHLATVAA
jgi:signal transduction histidine kinase